MGRGDGVELRGRDEGWSWDGSEGWSWDGSE